METSRVATLEPYPISTLVAHLVSVRFLSVASCVAQCASVPSGRLAHTPRMKPTNAAHRVGGRLQVLLQRRSNNGAVCVRYCVLLFSAGSLAAGWCVLLLRAQAPQVTASYGAEYE